MTGLDNAFSEDEARQATGIPDLVFMPMSEPRGHLPEGYQIATDGDTIKLLFRDSEQPFQVWALPFLDALAEKGVIRLACNEVGISRREFRLAMQFQPGFAEAVEDARADYADKIEEKVLSEIAVGKIGVPMDPKAYALAYRVLQAHAPERYGGNKGRTTKAMTDEQRRYLIAQLVAQGVTPQEALSIIDAATNAIKIASTNP